MTATASPQPIPTRFSKTQIPIGNGMDHDEARRTERIIVANTTWPAEGRKERSPSDKSVAQPAEGGSEPPTQLPLSSEREKERERAYRSPPPSESPHSTDPLITTGTHTIIVTKPTVEVVVIEIAGLQLAPPPSLPAQPLPSSHGCLARPFRPSRSLHCCATPPPHSLPLIACFR